MTTRRDFIAGSAALAGGMAFGVRPAAAWPPADKIARVGLELYTVRSEMEKSVANTLARVAQIGYKEVEFAGYFDTPPEKLREMLDKNGMTSPSVHTAIELLEGEFAKHAAAAKIMGHQWLIVPSLNTRRVTTVETWRAFAKRFNELGKKARDAGLRFAFHNHAVEPAPIADGTRPYDVFMGETDPAVVDFQMDLYWMIKAGGDPLAYFAKHPGRFPLVHVKDGSPTPIYPRESAGGKEAMQQRDVGSGSVDWKAILSHHNQAGIRHYYVEHDDPVPDAFTSVQKSYDYLAKLEF